MKNIKILLLNIILKSIVSTVLQECEISNYCGKEKNPCSKFGNCNFNIFDYYKKDSTDEDKQPHCECIFGYSSYNVDNAKFRNVENNNINCCYKKKGMFTPFFLELFIGFGIGHFYLGGYILGVVKLVVQLFLCTMLWCTAYFACSKEHTFQTNYNEINNNDKVTKIIQNDKKNDEIKNDNKEIFDDNENYDNDSNENKNNNESEYEENKENEMMFKNFVSCPKSMFIIYVSTISFFLFNIIDICLIAFGVFKDENGEELYMWN